MTTTVPLLLFLLSAAIIVTVFAVVARSTSREGTVDPARANRLRGTFFLSLLVILGIFLALTLPRLPYPAEAAVPDGTYREMTTKLTDPVSEEKLDIRTELRIGEDGTFTQESFIVLSPEESIKNLELVGVRRGE